MGREQPFRARLAHRGAMMQYSRLLRFILPSLLAIAAAGGLLFSAAIRSEATQNPRVSIDMITTGTTYDDTSNTMTVGTIDGSLSGAQAITHTHATHLVINDVEDLVAFQVRLNYVGDKMRPSTWNPTPFTDNNLGQAVGFVNLPIDQVTGVHRSVTPAQAIPVAPADNTNTPQTALVGSAYGGTQTFPISADTPHKAVPDDASYDAPTGGVLGRLTLQVVGNECGNTMLMDLDDDNPNVPGTSAVVFNGTGTTTIFLTEAQQTDGTHTETCTPPTATPSPSPSPSPTPTPKAPKLSLDMDRDGTSYSDPGLGGDNSLSVGTVDNCLTTEAPGNEAAHNHQVDLVLKDVDDLVGWQARLNYQGGKMRPLSVNFSPYADTSRGQDVSFVNLPVDAESGIHRSLVTGSSIPPPAPGAQTALVGSAYVGAQNAAVSADTPPKNPAEDTSYNAPSGGVVATITLRVEAGHVGFPSLAMDVSDSDPNAPGSSVTIFTGSGTMDIVLSESALADGFHGEGTTCIVDNDHDTWSDSLEGVIGTDPFDSCPDNTSDNAWPADINNDGFSDISDVVPLLNNFGVAVPPAPARQNIAPDPLDSFIDISDISRMRGFFGATCTTVPQ
jgi:hypothetical protein